jgi:hypothetical protein
MSRTRQREAAAAVEGGSGDGALVLGPSPDELRARIADARSWACRRSVLGVGGWTGRGARPPPAANDSGRPWRGGAAGGGMAAESDNPRVK